MARLKMSNTLVPKSWCSISPASPTYYTLLEGMLSQLKLCMLCYVETTKVEEHLFGGNTLSSPSPFRQHAPCIGRSAISSSTTPTPSPSSPRLGGVTLPSSSCSYT